MRLHGRAAAQRYRQGPEARARRGLSALPAAGRSSRPRSSGVSDLERAGLLAGAEEEPARTARIRLLEELIAEGIPLAELKRAVAEERLVLLPVERALAGEPRYTATQVAKLTGLSVDFVRAQRQAAGLPLPGPRAKAFTDEDVEAYRRTKRYLDAGLSEEGLIETSRTVGQAMATIAAATRTMTGEALLVAGDSEYELAQRYREAAESLVPLLGASLDHLFRLQLRELVRRDVVTRAELQSGRLEGAADMAVAFADLVGFTRLGESLPTGDLGRVATRLAAMAAAVAQPPVRLVKTIGDAAMLVSDEPARLVDACLDLVAAAERDGEDFPQLKAGIAHGPALARGGDWYGHTVNLAARITQSARPGSVLAAAEVREALGEDGYRWSPAGRRRLKGIHDRVRLYRVRPAARGDG